MVPSLRAGMVALVEPCARDPRRGDILVFRSGSKLVAHRLVTARGGAFVTCGDAHPDRPEIVPRDAVLGRVTEIRTGPSPSARRVDDRRWRLGGYALRRTRRLRAVAAFVRTRAALLAPAGRSERDGTSAEFAALVRATRSFERGEAEVGAASLASVPTRALVETAKRHHASGLLHAWFQTARASGSHVAIELGEAVARVRFASALQAPRVLARVFDVVKTLRAVGIEPIVLKGGARLAAGEDGADLQFSGDVDALVRAADIDRAVRALRDAGYREFFPSDRVAFFAARHHHHAPLALPGEPVPVEVHVALATPRSVTRSFAYDELDAHAIDVEGPIGRVRVLDRVRGAVHLAYHGRDLRVWRDVVLLARRLRAFSPAELAAFDAEIAREKRDRVRLRAAVACARAVAGLRPDPSFAERTYVRWAIAREHLPEALRRRAHVVEHLVGRCPRHFVGVRESMRHARGWFFNVVATPTVALAWIRDAAARDAARELFA